jgi:hypothetical protein
MVKFPEVFLNVTVSSSGAALYTTRFNNEEKNIYKTIYFCDNYGSQNRQRVFPDIAVN